MIEKVKINGNTEEFGVPGNKRAERALIYKGTVVIQCGDGVYRYGGFGKEPDPLSSPTPR